MANFIYYIPGGGPTLTPEFAKQIGLGHVFDKQASGVNHIKGPLGTRGGYCFSATDQLTAKTSLADTWAEMPGTDARIKPVDGEPPVRVLLGYSSEDPPKPEDLIRPEIVDGYYVPLGDGNPWAAPAARDHTGGGCVFPTRTAINDKGEFIPGDMSDIHTRLWALACEFYAYNADGAQDGKFWAEDFAALRNAALFALSVNYRVGASEVVALNLFDTDKPPMFILCALMGMPDFEEEGKKKQENSSLSDGEQD